MNSAVIKLLSISFKICYFKKDFIITVFLLAISGYLYAQDNPQWKLHYNHGILWYHLTTSGIIIMGNNDGLHGIDPQSQTEVWNLANYSDMPEQNIRPYKSTPFLEVIGFDPPAEKGGVGQRLFGQFKNPLKGIKDFGKKAELPRSILIDPATGNIIFDSKNTGFDYIVQKDFLPQINCILIQGDYNKKQSLGLFDIIAQKTLWIKDKPVQLKRISFVDDELKPYVDGNGNIMYSFIKTTYRVNAQTGDYIWQRPGDSLHKFVFAGDKDYCYATGGSFVAKVNLQTGAIVKEMTPDEFKTARKDTTITLSDLSLFLKGISIFPMKDALLASYSSGFNLLNYDDLTPLWPSKLIIKDYNIKNILKTDEGNYLVFLRNISNNQDAITLIDAKGTVIWQKPYMIKGSVLNMVDLNTEGIICITNEAGDFIDWKTGQSELTHPIVYNDSSIMIAHARENKSVAVYANEKLYEINYGRLSAGEILHDSKFKGKDPEDKIPGFLEVRKDGYFLSAPQNMMLIGFDGTIKYNKYFEKPGISDRSKLWLAHFGGLVAGYTFNKQAQQLTNTLYGTGVINTPTYTSIHDYDNYYHGTGSALIVSGLTGLAFTKERARYEALQKGRNYQLVFTKLETGGTGFMKIDKDSGNTLSTIRLDDKEPTILMDDALSGMYYISKNDEDLSFYNLYDDK